MYARDHAIDMIGHSIIRTYDVRKMTIYVYIYTTGYPVTKKSRIEIDAEKIG